MERFERWHLPGEIHRYCQWLASTSSHTIVDRLFLHFYLTLTIMSLFSTFKLCVLLIAHPVWSQLLRRLLAPLSVASISSAPTTLL